MRKNIFLFTFGLCLCTVAGAAASVMAADAPKKPKALICAMSNYYQCSFENGCQSATAEELNAPRFFKILLDRKKIVPVGRPPEDTHESRIMSLTRVGDMIVLQGVEDGDPKRPDGVGWTASISIETGRIALTASGLEVGFVGMGACSAY